MSRGRSRLRTKSLFKVNHRDVHDQTPCNGPSVCVQSPGQSRARHSAWRAPTDIVAAWTEFFMATSLHKSPYAEALYRWRMCRNVPTTHRLVASWLGTVGTAVRAAARAAPSIIKRVSVRVGAMPKANVTVGALMDNILGHVSARCGAVEAAEVSAGGHSAKAGGGPVGIRRGRRTRRCVCSARRRPVCHGAWQSDGTGGGVRWGDGERRCGHARRRVRVAQLSRARSAVRRRVRDGPGVC